MDLRTGSDGVTRCGWCGDDPLYVRYHDTEWGVPVHGDRRLFELLVLEGDVAEPTDAWTDFDVLCATTHRNQPSEGIAHRDRLSRCTLAAGQRNVFVDEPTDGRATDGLEPLGAFGARTWQETLEYPARRGQSAERHCHHGGTWPRSGTYDATRFNDGFHQSLAGVADGRSPGVGDVCDHFTATERLDWQLTPQTRIVGRVTQFYTDFFQGGTPTAPIGGTRTRIAPQYFGTLTHVFGANAVNEIKVGRTDYERRDQPGGE